MPTIAIDGRVNRLTAPRTHSTGGGIVNFLESFWILGATIGADCPALLDHMRPFLFGCLAGLAIKYELRRFGGKSQAFELGQGDVEDLAGHVQ